MQSSDDIETLLARAREGDGDAASQLVVATHGELRRLAGVLMGSRGRDHTLQATALVNEAFVRMAQSGPGEIDDLRHFIRKTTKVMRTALVDHERAKRAQKRGGDQLQVTLSDVAFGRESRSTRNLIDIDDAIKRLAEASADLAAVVELRYFGGLEVDAVASALEISKRTAERRWQMAREWLVGYLHTVND